MYVHGCSLIGSTFYHCGFRVKATSDVMNENAAVYLAIRIQQMEGFRAKK